MSDEILIQEIAVALADAYNEGLKEAADTIEALRAENAKLLAALKPFTELPCAHMVRFSGAPDDYVASEMIPYGIIRAARTAMGETE